MLFETNILTVIVMTLLGGLGAYMSNQSIAVFHDGIRPLLPQYIEGAMDRKSLLTTSFALSFGLIVGFGIPISIAGKIIIANTIMLASDVIGIYFSDKGKEKWLATIAGGLFAIILLFAMKYSFSLIELLPINFIKDLDNIGSLILVAFSVFPSISIAYQVGPKIGGTILLLTMLIKQLTTLYGTITINSINIKINPNGMALFFSILAMVFIAVKVSKKAEGESQGAFKMFTNNIEKIKSNMIILSISGGIVALATTLLIIGEGPASIILTSNGEYFPAALVALVRTLGFIPLVMTTSIISGVYSPAGTKAVHIPAILFINMGIVGLIGSFTMGVLIMILEILLLGFIAEGMDKLPGMKDLGDNARSAMSKVIDLSLLVGGMLTANAIAPTIGYIWVLGIYFLNENCEKSISPTAIGPIGAITMGIIVNILYVIGLFPIN